MQNDGQNDGDIHHETVVEEGLTDDAQIRKHGQFGLEGLIDHALRRRAAIENIHAEEVGNAHAECGQRKAGHVLVGAKTDGEKAVNQAAEHRRNERAEE